MTSIKAFGLATLTALLVGALAGTPSAMAESTSFCAVDPGNGPEEVCPAGELVTHIHEASTRKAKLLTSAETVECDVLSLGDALEELGSPLPMETAFTYSNCSNGCEVTEENGPATMSVSKEGHEAGWVTAKWLLNVNCSHLNCTYAGKGIVGKFSGQLLSISEVGETSTQEQEAFMESGLLCTKKLKLDLQTAPLSAISITG